MATIEMGLYHYRASRQRIQAALRKQETRFRAIFEKAAIGITLADLKGRILETNPALRAMLGYSEDELRHMRFIDITHADDVAANLALFEAALAGRRDHYQMEKRYIRKDGSILWAHLTVSLVRDAAGQPEFSIGMLQDITERKKAEQRIRQMAYEDSLTGLSNRRKFFEVLPAEIARARRYELSLALIILDLDNLKRINDQFGHQAGDEALQQVARAMRQVARQTDLMARISGDEFVLLLPHTSLGGAATLARRLMTTLEQVQLEGGAGISISARVAALQDEDDEAGEDVLRRADQALYRAKAGGRGRVVVG